MKIELNESQIDTILRGLDALAEAAESENRCTNDADIHESNDNTIRAVNELWEYLNPRTVTSGEYTFELVSSVLPGYTIWNIGSHMVDGYLPLCRLKPVQPFPGGRAVEVDTLKAIRCDGAQVILAAIGYGPDTPEKMEKYIAKHSETGRHAIAVKRMQEALPYMRQIKWN